MGWSMAAARRLHAVQVFGRKQRRSSESMSSLDDLAIYFFVRGDLREEDQMVQFGHAMFEMMSIYDPAFAKYRVVGLDGGVSEKAFNRTRQKLNNRQVPHVEYADPDHKEWGVTAIVTIPLTKEQALPLANYRLRRCSPPSEARAEVALNGQRGANSECLRSSEKEHLVSNQEVVGSIPTASSNSTAEK